MTETCVTPTCVAPRHVDASRDFIFIFGLVTNALNVRNNNSNNNFPGLRLHLYLKIPFSDTHLILDVMQQWLCVSLYYPV